MAFVATLFVSVNTTVFPTDFFGPALALKFDRFPVFFSPDGLVTNRVWLANAHFWAGLLSSCRGTSSMPCGPLATALRKVG